MKSRTSRSTKKTSLRQPPNPKPTTRTTRNSPARVAFGLGSNLGDREAALRRAIARLAEIVTEARSSRFHETKPVPPSGQPLFLNAALSGRCALSARQILAFAQNLEREAGRQPGPRWGPRPLDVDLLVLGDLVLDEPELTLPHPRMRERRFVLEPLAEIAPDLPVPPDGRTIAQLLAGLG
jgi:2-amino-4-hydroxy-6-hydroxymethyldihydropteridine diphosphokinase